eukprot:362865-Chlamydomonas_euryale.AAC.2
MAPVVWLFRPEESVVAFGCLRRKRSRRDMLSRGGLEWVVEESLRLETWFLVTLLTVYSRASPQIFYTGCGVPCVSTLRDGCTRVRWGARSSRLGCMHAVAWGACMVWMVSHWVCVSGCLRPWWGSSPSWIDGVETCGLLFGAPFHVFIMNQGKC